MNNRMAGTALGLGSIAGVAGAFGADALVHDDVDRVAQDYKAFFAQYQAAPEEVKQVYDAVFAQDSMSGMDRMVATAILNGSQQFTSPGGTVTAETKGGKKAIELAQQVAAANPGLGIATAGLARQEQELFIKEAEMRTEGYPNFTEQDTVAAANAGAGVSPVPAILGGLAAGSLGAGGVALLGRRAGR